jgi:hypothetical protein
MNTRKFIIFFNIVLFVFLFSISMFAQTSRDVRLPEREYVIGIDDRLDILAWKSEVFTTRVAVRSDGKITMPLLGDVPAAGLKVSTLKADLENRLAKYLKEPQVTITVESSKKIRIRLNGIIALENEFPRGTTLGQVLQGLIPTLQQLPTPPDLSAMKLIGVEEVFPINGQAILEGRNIFANLRLEWGDEIFIPAQNLPEPVTPTTVVTPFPVVRRAEFTTQEYDDFQTFLNDYPSTQELLQAYVTSEDDKVYIDLDKIPEDQLNGIEEEVLIELEKYAAEVQEELPKFIDATLMGISVNLALEELLEAFLAFPDPNSEEGIQIERFQEGDIIEKGDTAADDIILDEIRAETNQAILRKGEEIQVLPLLPNFSDITLSGILHIGEKREAVLGNLKAGTMDKPTQRKRFKEGDEIEDDIILAEISRKWVLLEKGEDIQLVFLRDSRNRTLSSPIPAPLLTQNGQVPETGTIEEGQALPESLQMLDPSVLNQLQTQGRELLMSPADIERLLVYNAFLAKLSQTLDDQGVSLTEVLQPLFRLARERTGADGDSVAENRAVLLTLAMYVNGKSVGDLVGIGGAAPRPREVQVSLLNRPDLAQHFLVSAAITAIADSEVADMVGLSKEVDDSQGGSGFSFADLTADRAGVRFAELATGNPRQAQLLQQQMSGAVREADFMPQVARLPEGIMEEDFQQRYQDTDSDAYRMVNEEIERRIAACRIYQ